MRNAFAEELTFLAAQNEKAVLLSGDIGNRLFDEFKTRYPNRFYNCGVAEANMIGVAAGLTLSSFRAVVYTIASFATVRCLEQIRNDVCYHNIPVIIVGVGAGLSYAGLGATHQSCEDIAMLRSLPNMTVVCPGDAIEVRRALREAFQWNGPVYLRLGKRGEPIVHTEDVEFSIGKAITVRRGNDVCLLSVGNMLPLSLEAGEVLSRRGISTRVVSFHTVKPLDMELLEEVFSSCSLVVSLEEHSKLGGFGSAIAEWFCKKNRQARFLSLGTEDCFLCSSGSQKYFREYFGLSLEGVLGEIMGKYREIEKRALC